VQPLWLHLIGPDINPDRDILVHCSTAMLLLPLLLLAALQTLAGAASKCAKMQVYVKVLKQLQHTHKLISNEG